MLFGVLATSSFISGTTHLSLYYQMHFFYLQESFKRHLIALCNKSENNLSSLVGVSTCTKIFRFRKLTFYFKLHIQISYCGYSCSLLMTASGWIESSYCLIVTSSINAANNIVNLSCQCLLNDGHNISYKEILGSTDNTFTMLIFASIILCNICNI